MFVRNHFIKNLWQILPKVFLFTVFGILFQSPLSAQIEEDTLQLGYPKDTIDLGKVVRGEKIVYKFTLTNHYSDKAEIFQIWPSCGCTSTDGKGFTLNPGESKEVEFAFNSDRISSGVHLKSIMFAADKGGFNIYFRAEVLD